MYFERNSSYLTKDDRFLNEVMTIKRLSLLILSLLFINTVTFASSAVHYSYQDQNQENHDYWFSEEAIKIETQGSNNRIIIYRANNNELITLNPNSREAIILDREGIKQLIKKIKRIYQRMQQLPESQRRMMEDAMGGMVEKIKEAEEIAKPEFVQIGPTTWKDQSAQKGVFRTDGDTSGSAVILDEPPVSIEDEERKVLEKFKDFFVEVLRLSSSVSQSLDLTETLSQSRSLLGDLQFRLAEFQSPDTSLSLTDWGRTSVSDDFFSIPENYSTRRPNFQGNPSGTGKVPGGAQQ